MFVLLITILFILSFSTTLSEFRREGVNPTAWIWPDRMSVYLHMNHESEVDYSKRGPGAYQALASGNVPASFRGLPVYTSYPLDTDFNGAPISLLERDRMCGEWFYICHDEEIAIFSAEHDKFMTITYEQAARADVRYKHDEKKTGYQHDGVAEAGYNKNAKDWGSFSHIKTAEKAHPPILIFRPFQTWTMASCILLKAGSELGNTFRKCAHSKRRVIARTHFSHSFLNPSLFLRTQTDTTTCSCRTTPSARLWSGTTRFTRAQS